MSIAAPAILARLNRRASAVLVLRALGVGLLFLMHLVLARVLPTSDYGIFSHAVATAALVALLSAFGWPMALSRFAAQYVELRQWGRLKGVLLRAHQFSLAGAAVTALGLWAVTLLIDLAPGLSRSFRFAAVLLPLTVLVALRRWALQGLQDVYGMTVPEEVVLPLLVIGGALALGIGSGSGALVLYIAAAAVAFALGTWRLRRVVPEEGLTAAPEFLTRTWLPVALPMLAAQAGQQVLNRTDLLLLGGMVGMESAGLYAAANRLAQLVTFAMLAASTVAAPMLTAAHYGGRPGEFGAVFRRALQWSALGALPLLAVLLLVPELLLGLFGSEFTAAAPWLRVLALGQFVSAACGPIGYALVMSGRERAFAGVAGLTAAVNVGAHLLAIPRWGGLGAAWVTAASVAVLNLGCLAVMVRDRARAGR